MRHLMIATVAALWAIVAAGSSAESPIRESLDLNGDWEFQKVSELDAPPQAGAWQATVVPGTLRGWNYERVWFRRSFTLPPAMQGKRIKIQFDGVKYNSRIYVNGQCVGGCFNGYDAFEVDATDAVRFDGPNRLEVGCHDWTGVFSEGKFDFSEKPDWQRPRRYVTDKVIAPIGGHYDYYGIWGDVTLLAHPAVYVKDLFIKPSVRQGELRIDYTVANESPTAVQAELRANVEDHNRDVLTLPTETIEIPAGGEVTKTMVKPWPNARYWSHEDPYLYHLRSELSTGDVLRTRFGFREFWIEGHRYVLNGSKINLLATSWWPPTEKMEREEIEQRWQALKSAGIVCFRTHTQPWRRVHYDVADEVGLLMIIEGAMWHDPYCTCYDDPRYWSNYEDMIHAMIRREKNRPSVIMWSMDNEAYSGEEKTRLAVAGLAAAGRKAKQWDPTRPIYFESDGDPEGVADAIGMHYIHEYPKYTCWPNEAYWLDKPFNPKTWFGIKSEPTVWKREKPLYIGEFLWVPSGTPAAHTVFFGDEAYQNLDEYTRLGKAEAWKMQILAFRHQEAGGMCPWTVGTDLDETNPLYRAHQYAYQPVAAYCLDYDRRFYAGETVTRRVEVFNDVLSDSVLTCAWTLNQGTRTIAQATQQISLPAGEKQMLTVDLPMPKVDSRTPLAWRLTIERDGQTVFEDTHAYSVFPRMQLPQVTAAIAVYDPRGDATRLLTDSGVATRTIQSLQEIDARDQVLVIGNGAFDEPAADTSADKPIIGRVDPQRGAMMNFLGRGGRVLVLRQNAYPEGLFDVEPTPQQSTMTFPLQPSHPALKGLDADDLKFWRGDHMVADHELPRPATGAVVSIVTSGSDTGIAHAPLLERPLGQGALVQCQMQLVEKASTEPAAAVLLGNLLKYLDEYEPVQRKTAVLGCTDAFREYLLNLGLRFDELDGNALALEGYSSLILHGQVEDADQIGDALDAFVKSGGNLLVHRPTAEAMDLLHRTLGLDFALQPYTGPVARGVSDSPLQESITREDLYWTIKQPGLSWRRQPLSQEMADGIFGRAFDAKDAAIHQIEAWETDGAYVMSSDKGVLFASAGTAVGVIEFPATGMYGIGVRAKGTPCRDVYPAVEISVDGRPFGSVQLEDGEWGDYGVFGQVAEGRRRVTVAFVNDASDPPREDRNLEVDCVLVTQDAGRDRSAALTAPPAVLAQAHGSGTIVFDRLRWDTEQGSGRQAARYACSLLTALEADFTPRSAVTLECERMTPQPEMKYYSADGSTAYMGCNGYIKTAIQVTEARSYSAELVASGDDSDGICPLVEIRLDDQKLAEVQLTTEGWRSYRFPLELPAGEHEMKVWFMNDHSSPSGDRNLRLDKLMIYNDPDQ